MCVVAAFAHALYLRPRQAFTEHQGVHMAPGVLIGHLRAASFRSYGT